LPAPDGPIFAAGRTGRDWKTFAAAVDSIGSRVTTVSGRDGAALLGKVSNIEVLVDIPYDQYRERLRAARIVVVPLETHVYSSGQVVVLEAMALGKPVVATRVLGTEDYIRDGIDGLLVEPGDAAGMRAAINKILSSPELERSLGANAVQVIRDRHTLQKYVADIAVLASGTDPADR
jgi:glycosyltransferase involved in cell wall biosynthesis